jgi:TonB family protein
MIPAEKESTMNRSRLASLSSTVLSATALCLFSLPVSGQTPAEIEGLATRTAERVMKTHQQHIFVAGLTGCQLDAEDCALFEASLRATLEKMAPGVHFVKRENVINILEGRGFIAIDAYFPDVLKAVASSAGADVLVTDTLEWQSDGYELTGEVYDELQGKKLDEFRAKIVRPVPDSGGEPMVFTDPESGVSLMIPRGKQSRHPVVEQLLCARCPDPTYTPEARADRIQGRVLLLATVTEQGVAEHIGIISGLGDGLTDQALEAARNWRFKPAIGKDGKSVAVRVPIEITFRLH